ncbi:serine threonine-protein [Lynx pardinus]|nr:serine threonine-protein [Lynx pardinus]
MRHKTRKENGKQVKKEEANQKSSAGRPTPWFLPQSRSLPASPLRLGSLQAHRAGRSSSIPCGAPRDAKELARQVRRSVDLELDRCRQQAGFPVSWGEEEASPCTPEVDSGAEEPLEPTQEEWRQVLTIFSASNYYEVGSNRGAYVKLGPALTPYIVQYQANKVTHMLTMRQRISRVEESALRALREKLFAHSSDLLGEFKKHDTDKTGLITLSDWAEAVESVLHLGLPWRMLRPQLVNSSTDNTLEYKSWLEDLAKEQLNRENIQSSLLETLYRNRSNLETIFRIIDSDHSGFISLDEFRHTWKLFSSHMNINITDDCICDLARSIDFNKDGHIDINEFLEAFRLVEQSCSEGNASDCPQTTNTNDNGCSKPGTH